MNRNISLDIARTSAIVLMVIFHFIYDLMFFGFVELDIPDGEGWKQFRWVIISLFFLCLGISLQFAHENGIQFKKFILRFLKIAFFAFLISIASYLAIRENWIFFGVLHFLAFASLVALPLINRPIICALLGILFFALGAIDIVPSRWPFYLIFENLPSYTNDYVAIVPWLGMVFFGVSLAHTNWLRNDPLRQLIHQKIDSENSKTIALFTWPGKHSLAIYVLHQPFLMGMLYVLRQIID